MNKELLAKYDITIDDNRFYCTGLNMLKIFYDYGQKTKLYSEFINYFGSIELLDKYIKHAYQSWIIEQINGIHLNTGLFNIFNNCLDWSGFHEANKSAASMEEFYYSDIIRNPLVDITFEEFFKSITYDLIYSDE